MSASSSGRASRVLLPVGQRLGELHPGPGRGTSGLLVHPGPAAVLLDGDAGDVWDLAHGLTTHVLQVPWDRAQLAAVLLDRRPADLDRTVADLLDRGLLVEVDPQDAGAFLARHRWYSALTGLGHQPRDGGWTGALGFPGAPPVREVAPRVYEFWSLAPEFGSLQGAVDFLAAAAADDPDAPAEETDPAALAAAVVDWLHDLLCVGAGWLEVVA